MAGINRSIRLDPALWADLDRLAAHLSVSRNQALSLALQCGLPQLQRAVRRGWTVADGVDGLIEARRVREIIETRQT